jgi:trans-2-enoyl-CoA reductase
VMERISTENVRELSDLEGFQREFLHHHGFARKDVDYTLDVQP